ncbi:unnamed protein product, partial [Owenia fusiformis]
SKLKMSFLRKSYCFVSRAIALHSTSLTKRVCHPRLLYSSPRRLFSDDTGEKKFDVSTLKDLVCPLTKKPLRYDPETNELISDDISAAYPIINGIPNLTPEDARHMNSDIDPEDENVRNIKDRD